MTTQQVAAKVAATVAAKELAMAVKAAEVAMLKRAPLPELLQVAVKVKSGGLLIEGTSLEQRCSVSVRAETEGEGGVLVSPAGLRALLPKTGEVGLSVEKDALVVSSALGQSRIQASDVSAFPELPVETASFNARLTVDAEDLAPYLEWVNAATSDDIARYALCHVLCEFENGLLRLIACNGHRLNVAEVAAGGNENEGNENRRFFLFNKTAKHICELLETDKLEISIGDTADKQVAIFRFTHKGLPVEFVALSEKPDFPQWRRVVPQPDETVLEVEVDKAQLIEPLRQAVKLAKPGRKQEVVPVAMTMHDGCITLYLTNPVNTEFAPVPAKVKVLRPHANTPFRIRFNPAYLLAAVNQPGNGRIVIAFTGKDRPAKFQGDGPAYCVLMPFRLE